MKIRLQKIIADAGLASRREAERWIEQGKVRVNGQVVTQLGSLADPAKDRLQVDGLGQPGVLLTGRRANDGGQGDDYVGALYHTADQSLFPDIALDELKVRVGAQVKKTVLLEPKTVYDRYVVTGLQHAFRHYAAQVTGAACDQYFHILSVVETPVQVRNFLLGFGARVWRLIQHFPVGFRFVAT